MTATDLTLVTMGALAVVACALWLRRSSPDDPDGRKGALAALLLGAGAIVLGAWRSLPPPPPPEAPPPSAPVEIVIDRDDDYRGGMPGGVFLAQHTRHMMRNPARGFMWSPNGSTLWEVGWIVRAPRAGRYELWVRYATDRSRPGEIWVNDRMSGVGLARTTAQPFRPEWFREGGVELGAGPNQLWFSSRRPLPHIDSLRLVQPATG